MPINPQFKVNQLAKDLGIRSKEITDMLMEKGIDVKTQKVLEPWEFDILFETLTRAYQVTDIDRYIDGDVTIPSRLKAIAEASERKDAAEKAAAEKAEADKAAAEKAAAEKAAAEKAAAEKVAAEKAAADKAAAEKAEAPKAEPAKAELNRVAEQNENVPAKTPDTVSEENKSKQDTAPHTEKRNRSAQDILNEQRMQAQLHGQPMPGPVPPKQPSAPSVRQSTANNQFRTRQDQSNINTQPRFQNQSSAGVQQSSVQQPSAQQPRPQGQFGTQRPRPQGQFGTQQQRPQGQFGGQQRPQQGQFGGQQRPQGQFGGQRPQYGQRPQNGGRIDDKENVQSAPRERFQPQPIVRSQTPKGGGDTKTKQRGATRIVDTRTTEVDLSKYDEKLDTFENQADPAVLTEAPKIKKGVTPASRQQTSQIRQPVFNRGNQKNIKKQPVPVKKTPLNVQIPDEIIVSDLASRLKVTAGEVVKRLIMMGVMATVNQTVDFDTASLVAEELGAVVTKEVVVTIEEKLFGEDDDKDDKNLVPRAPVICVMGHVDHGKTSLLDAIRNTHVTSGEAGGITQHIGAYRVKVKGRDITFLDTPGHEAFTAMRARGAQATDIAILVVAADDGIMPQTVEAINHAKAAGVEIVVAINKIDKPAANPENIKQELTKYDLIPEEWGGDVMCVPVSAVTHQGIDDLLEAVLLVADVKEYKANSNKRAKGIVIEAKLDKGRGPVATILVQNGTLRPGDIVIAGTAVGRVRNMTDHMGKNMKSAGPSVPVEITGLDAVPTAGDEFNAVDDERMARELADRRRSSAKEASFKANARASLDDLFAAISDGVKTLSLIVKADVDGSAEAVKSSLDRLSNDEVKVNVIHSAVGGINEGDVMFAAASNAIIIGFNVRPDRQALDSAERQGVEIRTYRVIYDCINEISAAMKGMLAPTYHEVLQGHIEVRQVFKISKVGVIAGSYVQDGKVTRSSKIRIVRDGTMIYDDQIASLRREKDDVKEVAEGYECGIGLEKYSDLRVGDIFEAYIMEEVAR